MNELQILTEKEVLGRTFRIYGDAENPLFLARDVAEWIEYAKTGAGSFDVSRMLSTLDEDEKLIRKIFVAGQNRDMWFLTEDGLYETLMQSTKPIAKQFKSEVKRILKEIRRTGGYVNDDEQFIGTYLPFADEQTKLMFRATLSTVKTLNARLEGERPKVLFAEAVETSQTSILIGDLAKILKQNGVEIGAKRLFAWLRENDYLMKTNTSRNLPTQRAMELGLFEIKERTVNNPDGSILVTRTTKVTGKGQTYFVNQFLSPKRAVQ